MEISFSKTRIQIPSLDPRGRPPPSQTRKLAAGEELEVRIVRRRVEGEGEGILSRRVLITRDQVVRDGYRGNILPRHEASATASLSVRTIFYRSCRRDTKPASFYNSSRLAARFEIAPRRLVRANTLA